MSFTSILITGANRGIGLEFVTQLLALSPKPKHVIATTRQTTAEQLNALAASDHSLHVLPFDIRHYSQYEELVSRVRQIVGSDGIDLLINNAGILIKDGLDSVSPEKMIDNFEVNAVTPLMITKAFLPLLEVSAKTRKTAVVNITSRMGSIDDNSSGGYYPYRVSKASLNMISKGLAVDLQPKGISVVSLHPGWVQTDMGGKSAPLVATDSVAHMINTIRAIDSDVNGKMLNYDGKPIPW